VSNKPDIDPYAPPTAQVIDSTSVSGYGAFPRISTWWVFLFTSITLGLYGPYWLYTRTKVLNTLIRADEVPLALSIGVFIASCASLLTAFLSGVQPDQQALRILATLANWGCIILTLICLYTFRNRLNEHDGIGPGHRYWIGGVAIFFFQVIYLNYKLNQRIDAERTDSAAGAVAYPAALGIPSN
jgi:hypothetical protein